MKKSVVWLCVFITIACLVFEINRVSAASSAKYSDFTLSAASGQYSNLYAVIVRRDTSNAVVAATGALASDAAWNTLDIAGTYNTHTGEWEFAIPAAMPNGPYKIKVADSSSPANTDTIIALAAFDKDGNRGIVNITYYPVY